MAAGDDRRTEIECPYCRDQRYCEECSNSGILVVHWNLWHRTMELRWVVASNEDLDHAACFGACDWRVFAQKWQRHASFFPDRTEEEWRVIKG